MRVGKGHGQYDALDKIPDWQLKLGERALQPKSDVARVSLERPDASCSPDILIVSRWLAWSDARILRRMKNDHPHGILAPVMLVPDAKLTISKMCVDCHLRAVYDPRFLFLGRRIW